jgi:subtilisin family serine protease
VGIQSAYLNGGYARWSGTSMAAPYVAGTAALLVSLHADWGMKKTLDLLELTARPIAVENPLHVDDLGAGEVNPAAAMLFVPTADPQAGGL